MTNRSGRWAGPSRVSTFRWALVATIIACPPAAFGNSIRVSPGAALEGRFGLELALEDPAARPATDAFIALGPEKGLHAETAVVASFSLDPRQLKVGVGTSQEPALPFLRLGEGPERVRLVVSVERGADRDWRLAVWSWDDAQGRWKLAVRTALPLEASLRKESDPEYTRLALEWTAAPAGDTKGRLRLLRLRPRALGRGHEGEHAAVAGQAGSERSDAEPVVLFDNEALDNAGQTVSYVQLGVLAKEHPRGVAGRLRIDDVEIQRRLPGRP